MHVRACTRMVFDSHISTPHWHSIVLLPSPRALVKAFKTCHGLRAGVLRGKQHTQEACRGQLRRTDPKCNAGNQSDLSCLGNIAGWTALGSKSMICPAIQSCCSMCILLICWPCLFFTLCHLVWKQQEQR